MRVIVLGAGASVHAGYPLASELLAKVEERAKTSSFGNLGDAWSRWVEFRDGCPESLQLVVRNNNPEIVLTLPTLLQAAADSEDASRTRAAVKEAQAHGVDGPARTLEEYYASASRDFLSRAKIGLAHLLHALDLYFLDHHVSDGHDAPVRGPLTRLLEELEPGDAVVTLNWDTTAERTLWELGKWSPLDGYGFQKRLLVRSAADVEGPVPATAMASPVKVLKLHGSFGWYQEDSEILFENAIYLDAFRFASAGQLVPLLDPGFGVSRYQGDHLLITPAFIKNLTHPALIAIWGGASEALGSADQVDVWGYSLPDADGAARALFLPLRERVRTGTTEVRIHDPSEGTRDRWRALLGTGVTMLNESLGRDVE